MLDTVIPVSDKRLAVHVTKDCLRQIRGGHRWVYDQSITKISHKGNAGDLAVIFDDKRKFAAIGLYDPSSPIRVRILHAGKPVQIDAAFWESQLNACLSIRQKLVEDSRTTGYRVINGESDGFPGLVLDKYDSTYVVKLYSTAWLPHLSDVTAAIDACTDALTVVLRFSRNTAKQNRFGLREGDAILGVAPTEPVEFLEHGLRFEADVVEGQKTGHFLDQRDNRIRVSLRSNGARVLDVFSCNGGFSVHAAAGGAKEVVSLDRSEQALENVEENFLLNQENPLVAACEHSVLCGDAFQLMQGLSDQKKKYNVIVVDPPSFAQRKSQVEAALFSYEKLTKAALRVLAPRGLLVQASCSSFVGQEDFVETVQETIEESGRKITDIVSTGHGIDHPSLFAESNYLKAVFVTVK